MARASCEDKDRPSRKGVADKHGRKDGEEDVSQEETEQSEGEETLKTIFGGFRKWWLDIHWAVMYAVAFLAWIGLGVYAISAGDVKRLRYPIDSYGNMCGHDSKVDKPYLLYFNIMACEDNFPRRANCPTMQICVPECPQVAFSPLMEPDARTEEGQTRLKKLMKPFCSHKFSVKLNVTELVEVKGSGCRRHCTNQGPLRRPFVQATFSLRRPS